MSLVSETDSLTTGLVTFQLLIGESDEDVTTTYGIKSISIHNACNRIPTASLIIIDGNAASQEYTASNATTFEPGTKIHIKAGYKFKDETVFKGIITKHAIKSSEKTSCLLVECKDEAFKLTLAKKNKIFYDSTESEIFEDIIADNGLTGDVEPLTFKHHELVQYHATDWDFLQSRIQVNNKLCFVENGTLTIKAPELTKTANQKASYGSNVFSFEAEIDARNQYESYEASAWNYTDQETITNTAENSGLNSTGNLSSSDLAKASGNNAIALSHGGQLPDAVLQSWAEGKSMYQQLNKISGTVKLQGSHELKPGIMLTLEGMSDRFNGDVFVSAVHHHIAEGNWFTNVNFGLQPEWFAETFTMSQLPAAGMIPAINGLHIGKVVALEGDPANEHRIQVKITTINKEEKGVWSRVLSGHAGENYGIHFLPEIGHEVLLGFLNDDPNQAIVLGSLFSNTNTAPKKYTDDNFEKVIMTKSNIKISLNDENKSIALDTPDGKQLIIDDKEGSVTLKDELDNIITMNDKGITISSSKDIKLKATGDIKMEGTNVEIKASAGFKAEASSTAEISGSGSVSLKGGIVKIN